MQRYNSYSAFFKETYGYRMQKLSIDAGFGCPNRDPGDRRRGGCTFCDNGAFSPSYCMPQKSITTQIDEGIEFHARRYRKSGMYLAYFQSYSNTYAPLAVLKERYGEALRHPQVGGIVIGTRPDCVDEEKLDYIASLASEGRYVAVEYGIESCYDATLARIRRGHDFAATRKALAMTAERGIHCGGHLIIGLPGESRGMIMDEAAIINSLPVDSLKLHQLQIIKGTALESESVDAARRGEEWARGFAMEDYVALVCDFLERLRPDISMERFAGEVPPRYQAVPERSWRRDDGRLVRNEEIPVLVERELERRGSWQGCLLERREVTTGKEGDR